MEEILINVTHHPIDDWFRKLDDNIQTIRAIRRKETIGPKDKEELEHALGIVRTMSDICLTFLIMA